MPALRTRRYRLRLKYPKANNTKASSELDSSCFDSVVTIRKQTMITTNTGGSQRGTKGQGVHFWSNKHKCVFHKHAIKARVSCSCSFCVVLARPWFFVVPEATHKVSQGPLKGAVSAQKALQGSETESRDFSWEERKRKVFPRQGLLWFFTHRAL